MKVYIANLGYKNVHWPVCKGENVLTLQTSQTLFDFWTRGEKQAWADWASKNERMMNGSLAIPPVASRWYNLLTIFHETSDDLWLHREGGDLHWTMSRDGTISQTPIVDPFGSKRSYLLLRRPTDPWRNRNKQGGSLQWRSLHAKSHDFLATEATYQELANDRGYRDYAAALIDGDPLDEWHRRPEWAGKQGTKGLVKVFSNLERTLWEAVNRIETTVARADGRLLERYAKVKELRVSPEEMRLFLEQLYRQNEGLCALTGLPMLLNGESGPDDFRLSVDRIDSNGHYEPTNIQLVCSFANLWKSDRDDDRFKELIAILRKGEHGFPRQHIAI